MPPTPPLEEDNRLGDTGIADKAGAMLRPDRGLPPRLTFGEKLCDEADRPLFEGVANWSMRTEDDVEVEED